MALLTRIFGRREGQERLKRRWNCPNEGMLAAYADNGLGDAARERLQTHLAVCEHCRALVASVVKLRRVTELPAVPSALVERARFLVPPPHKPWAWGWETVATAGTLACAVIAVTLLRPQQTLTIPEWPAPAAPTVSKDKPSVPAKTPEHETVRKLKSPEYLPTILFPQADKVIARERLEFRWNQVPDSLYYQVRVLSSEGDLIWEGDSPTTRIELPNQLTLHAGKYFVLVSAVMRNGRTRKSNPVGFKVADSQ